jgi:hypothetical protein
MDGQTATDQQPVAAEQQQTSNFLLDRVSNLESNIINAKSKLRVDLKNAKAYAVLALVAIIFIILHYAKAISLAPWVLITLWLVAIFLILAFIGTDTEKAKAEVERIEAIKRIYLGFPDSYDDRPEYFDSLVKINIENLAAYYSLVKTHTSQSFKVSLAVSVVGFILIAIGLTIGFESDKKMIGYISSASGVLVEFISGVLFYLYNKTVRQLKEYHDSLIGVQNVLLSFKLIESTSDDKAKADMITKMIEFLVQKKN